MKKVLCIFGTRPEAIKMAPLILQLKASAKIQTKVCITAQHRQLLDDVLQTFKIKADYDLDLMRDAQSIEWITQIILERLTPILKKESPDLVLVHGDTTTSFAAALAAFYQHIPVGHVEAGLRSYDYENPFPEELNRRLTDAFCSLHFAPSQQARKNLLKENIDSKKITVCGNTVIDALKWAVKKQYPFKNLALKQFFKENSNSKIALLTTHRRENFGKPLQEILKAVLTLSENFKDLHFIYPVHPNPNVKKVAQKLLAEKDNILLVDPLNYMDFCHLLKRSTIVLTDSGGLQEEAPALGKPVFVLRIVSERPEAILSGNARLVGSDSIKIVKEVSKVLTDPQEYKKMQKPSYPYGKGNTSEIIIKTILKTFS